VKSVHVTLIAAGLALVACNQDATGPTLDRSSAGTEAITVLTRNVYPGADLDAVIAALMSEDPNDDAPALVTAINTLQATDIATRARGFADEIAHTNADVVGFQEVDQLGIHIPPLGVDLDLDYLAIIRNALAERGLHYEVGAQVENIDVTLQGGAITFKDFDVVLYNADRVQWQTVLAQNFATNLGEVAPGVVLKRGYIEGTATIGTATYTVVSTHPEPDLNAETDLSELRYAQMLEIATVLGDASPAIVMGDLNDVPGSLEYQVLTGAGFTDVWTALKPNQDGFTCCHLADLSDSRSNFVKRIDFVFARGFGHGNRDLNGWVTIVGDQPGDRLTGPLYPIWPSDHAGVAAKLFVPPAPAAR
jgi:endonuclease/exonuclease/phosphatase family metal-dependent hydrolase